MADAVKVAHKVIETTSAMAVADEIAVVAVVAGKTRQRAQSLATR